MVNTDVVEMVSIENTENLSMPRVVSKKKTLEFESIITFGKYQGQTVRDVFDENFRYIKWIDDNLRKTHILSNEVKEELYATIANQPDTEDWDDQQRAWGEEGD